MLDDQLRDRLYESYASNHAGHRAPSDLSHGLIRDVLPHMPDEKDLHVVDIGCGQGELVHGLLHAGYVNTVGVDISPEQVSLANSAGITQVVQGDYRLLIEGRQVDVVVATDFLEHLTLSENLAAMDLLVRSLPDRGRVILRVPNAASPFGGRIHHSDLTHETRFTERSLRQLAMAAGFSSAEFFACPPPVHGAASLLRATIWRGFSGFFKLALAAETGQLRGHIVTQNLVCVLTK